MSWGKVTNQNRPQARAPSIRAASVSSGGRLSTAASRMMNMNGVHCQVSANTMAMRAGQGSLTHV